MFIGNQLLLCLNNVISVKNDVFFLLSLLVLLTLLSISLVFFLFFVASLSLSLSCVILIVYVTQLMASLNMKMKKRDNYGAEPDKKKLAMAGIRHQLLLLLRRRHRLFPLVSAFSGCLLLLLLFSFSFPPVIHHSPLGVRLHSFQQLNNWKILLQ